MPTETFLETIDGEEYERTRTVLLSINNRMHLTQTMVKQLLHALQHFAEHGELP